MISMAPEMAALMRGALAPCAHLRPGGLCRNNGVRYEPKLGHVPRGFAGATARLEDVKLIIVAAEPTHPQSTEQYVEGSDLLDQVRDRVYAYIRDLPGPFHSNARYLLDECFPETSFDEQMRQCWFTEAVLCSVPGGPMKKHIREVAKLCGDTWLQRQLALLPAVPVIPAGGKARDQVQRCMMHPRPVFWECHAFKQQLLENYPEARKTWKKAAEWFRRPHRA